MKKVNKWFFFNPLFVLYTDAEFYISMLKDPNQKKMYFAYRIYDDNFDPFDYDQRQMELRDTNEMERQILNHESANQLRKRFREESEKFSDFFERMDFQDYEYEKTPIALITFVLSVFLATDSELRKKFYTTYKSQKIPAITQWSFNTFRVSPISDRSTITDFRFIDDEYQATLYCCGLGNTFADKSYLKLYFELIITWFSLWEEHFNNDPNYYLEPVEFKRVDHVSTDKNYLCGLTVENEGVTWSETSYFQELSDDRKQVYMMLARVLDRVCVAENTVLPVPHKNILEQSFDEKKIVAKLIRFIVSECKGFLA